MIEEFNLPVRFEVWGDVDPQSLMDFLKRLLGKLFRLAC